MPRNYTKKGKKYKAEDITLALDPEKLRRFQDNATNTLNPNEPSSSGDVPQDIDKSAQTSNSLPAQIPAVSTNEAGLSTLFPQPTPSQIDSKVINAIPLKASTSFESLLLEKVNKHPHPVTRKRRKIDGKGRVITSEEFINEIKTKIKDNKSKVNKKVAIKANEQIIEESFTVGIKNKRKSKNKKEIEESSEESEVEVSDNSDDMPPPEHIDMLSIDNLQKDDLILARFKGGKRSVFTYRYLCLVLRMHNSNEIEVMGLKSVNDNKKEFIKIVDDIFFITKEEVIGKLPSPNIKEEIYVFSAPVDICEQH